MDKYSYKEESTLAAQVGKMIKQQKESWPVARQNYEGLRKVEEKYFLFNDFRIIVQFNPERIRSSAAKTDASSIRKRVCFLCQENRVEEQWGIDFIGKYTILINPFPIFPEHLTIPLNQHLPQKIEPFFSDMLRLSKQLPEFIIFYNGPESGASAPDHFHFQAGTKGIMPVDHEIKDVILKHGEKLFDNGKISINASDGNYLRQLIVMVSSFEKELELQFQKVLGILKERGQEGEPMMNILATWGNGQWQVIIFPRDRQRPDQFFASGEKQIIMSPASVELGGLAILPRKEDFDKINQYDLLSIYRQVSINKEDFEIIKAKIKE